MKVKKTYLIPSIETIALDSDTVLDSIGGGSFGDDPHGGNPIINIPGDEGELEDSEAKRWGNFGRFGFWDRFADEEDY